MVQGVSMLSGRSYCVVTHSRNDLIHFQAHGSGFESGLNCFIMIHREELGDSESVALRPELAPAQLSAVSLASIFCPLILDLAKVPSRLHSVSANKVFLRVVIVHHLVIVAATCFPSPSPRMSSRPPVEACNREQNKDQERGVDDDWEVWCSTIMMVRFGSLNWWSRVICHDGRGVRWSHP